MLYIPKARTVLLMCFASDQVHQALNILLIRSNKQKKRVCKMAFSICIHLMVSQLQMCSAYKSTDDLFNPVSLKLCL